MEAPRRAASSGSATGFWLKVGLGLLGVVLLLAFVRLPTPSPPAGEPTHPRGSASTANPEPAQVPEAAPATAAPALGLPALPPAALPGGADEEDARAASALAQKLRTPGARLGAADVRAAAGLLERHGEVDGIHHLAAAVFATVATQERTQRRLPEAVALAEQAVAADPANRNVQGLYVALLIEAADWSGAERAARDVLARSPGDAEGLWWLGYALFHQDRNREAIEALRDAVAAGDSGQAAALLARLEKGANDERGMTEQQLAHFHVRYDGESHEDVGREILRALERHYATLVTTLDYQPQQPIPVILFSTRKYYDAAGAPAWSGGAYDALDGRIRIPIGGLTSSLTPDLDGTLIHEVTHAFVYELSRGQAPRDLHEGLAQYMEGKRLASLLTPEQLAALAEGRIAGVGGFYLEALRFVEYLVGLRGMGGIRDLLEAMGGGADVTSAFRQVYGKPPDGLHADAQAYFRSRYGR